MGQEEGPGLEVVDLEGERLGSTAHGDQRAIERVRVRVEHGAEIELRGGGG
jgi:hypothetical protein